MPRPLYQRNPQPVPPAPGSDLAQALAQEPSPAPSSGSDPAPFTRPKVPDQGLVSLPGPISDSGNHPVPTPTPAVGSSLGVRPLMALRLPFRGCLGPYRIPLLGRGRARPHLPSPQIPAAFHGGQKVSPRPSLGGIGRGAPNRPGGLNLETRLLHLAGLSPEVQEPVDRRSPEPTTLPPGPDPILSGLARELALPVTPQLATPVPPAPTLFPEDPLPGPSPGLVTPECSRRDTPAETLPPNHWPLLDLPEVRPVDPLPGPPKEGADSHGLGARPKTPRSKVDPLSGPSPMEGLAGHGLGARPKTTRVTPAWVPDLAQEMVLLEDLAEPRGDRARERRPSPSPPPGYLASLPEANIRKPRRRTGRTGQDPLLFEFYLLALRAQEELAALRQETAELRARVDLLSARPQAIGHSAAGPLPSLNQSPIQVDASSSEEDMVTGEACPGSPRRLSPGDSQVLAGSPPAQDLSPLTEAALLAPDPPSGE